MRRTPALFQVLLVGLVLIAIASLFRSTPPKQWAAFCFAGAPVLLMARVPTRWMAAGTIVIGIALAAWYSAVNASLNPPPVIAAVYGVGGASIVSAVAHAIAGIGEDRAARFRTVAAVSLFPAKLYLGLLVLSTVATVTPLTYDLILSTVDHAFAGDASFAVGRLFVGRPKLLDAVMTVYDALPFAAMLAAAWRWKKRGRGDSVSIPLSAGIAAAVGAALYLIVPAAGPGFLWLARYPCQPPGDSELLLHLAPVDVQSFRNAMPSLHFTGALIVALGTWGMGRVARTLGVALLVITALATLGSGQHYIIDLVVAIPFTLAIEAAVRRAPRWQTICLFNALLVLGWLAVVRWEAFILTIPIVAPCAVIATIVGPIVAWRRGAHTRAVSFDGAEPAT